MALSPHDVRALDEIANDLSSSDPRLAVLLTVGAGAYTPERTIRRMRWLAVLCCLVAYVQAELGLIRGPAVMVVHGAALGVLAVVLFVLAGRRARQP